VNRRAIREHDPMNHAGVNTIAIAPN
jgi:hypothetical protein